jgi:hypothetical protein
LAVTLLGCGGSGNSSGDGGGGDLAVVAAPMNFAGINKQILQPSCTFSTCHSSMGARTSNMLNLQDSDDGSSPAGALAFASLVGQPSVNTKAAAAGLLRSQAVRRGQQLPRDEAEADADAGDGGSHRRLRRAHAERQRRAGGGGHSGDRGLDQSRRAAG